MQYTPRPPARPWLRAAIPERSMRRAARAGAQLLQAAPLDDAYRRRVDSLLALIGAYDAQIAVFTGLVATALTGHPGYRAIQAISGIGPVLAAIFVAEIDDVTRFADPGTLCSWAGLTPRHRESDTTVHRGPITKQGSRLVRWAAIEAIQLTRAGTKLSTDKARIIARRGRNIGKVAAARKLLTLVYYAYATDTSARWPRPGRREQVGTQPARVVVLCHDPLPARSPP
jgi:transposase